MKAIQIKSAFIRIIPKRNIYKPFNPHIELKRLSYPNKIMDVRNENDLNQLGNYEKL
jgi:hypothetical protein